MNIDYQSSCSQSRGNDSSRKSPFPMISVDEAIRLVLIHAAKLRKQQLVSLSDALGKTLSKDIIADNPFPPFRASILDGYAVRGPLQKGIHPVLTKRSHAGHSMSFPLEENWVSYVTTGAMVPDGANSVVKVEDTEAVTSTSINNQQETHVNILVDVDTRTSNIREIGDDIKAGELLLKSGTVLGPAEIGLLATMGIVHAIPTYAKPTIGVMSTGNELVEPGEIPLGGQIRDSNRCALLAAFREDGFSCIDLGIVRDAEDSLRDCLLEAGHRCDIVVTSGGVSMGDADFIKPILSSIGNIVFGRLNMKPGKPTTFATATIANRQVLYFGLPGNPASCLVTKSLLIDPACKRMQGLTSDQCMHIQVRAKFIGGPGNMFIALDKERPEYHRAVLSFLSDGFAVVQSTGIQRSSRLLSMASANALVYVPSGDGRIEPGVMVTAFLIRDVTTPEAKFCFHRLAATVDHIAPALDRPVLLDPPKQMAMPEVVSVVNLQDKSMNEYESFSSMLAKRTENVAEMPLIGWRSIRTALLTISDRAFHGTYEDESGPAMAAQLTTMSQSPDWPLTVDIVRTRIVPDDHEMIQQAILEWTSGEEAVDLILTSGGTGFSMRDITPEAVRPLILREAPGIAQALLNEGLKHTPLASLSRPVVGCRHRTLICTLPGSVKAVRENISALRPLLPRIMELMKQS